MIALVAAILHTPIPALEAMDWVDLVAYHNEAVSLSRAMNR